MNSAKTSNVGSEIVHFDHDGHGIIAGNKSHLKVDKISYKKNHVSENPQGGAYKVTIDGQVFRLAPVVRLRHFCDGVLLPVGSPTRRRGRVQVRTNIRDVFLPIQVVVPSGQGEGFSNNTRNVDKLPPAFQSYRY